MDDGVHEIVLHQPLTNGALLAPSVENTRKLYDGSRSPLAEGAQDVERKGEVGSGVGSQHAGTTKAVVVDEQRVVGAFPWNGVGRIAHHGIEGLKVAMLGRDERVAQLNIKIVVVDIVEEHVDAAEVVGRRVDFLAVVFQRRVFLADGLREFQQQRPGTAGRVVDAAYLVAVGSRQSGQDLADLLWREEFTTRLAGV